MSVVFPHLLTFLDRGKCNVCGNKGEELIHTNTSQYFGWETCNNENCNKIIQDWYIKTTISKDVLREKFGECVYIKRNSGILESDWEIQSDACQEKENGDFWLFVRNKRGHLRKEIKLSDLKKWNKW